MDMRERKRWREDKEREGRININKQTDKEIRDEKRSWRVAGKATQRGIEK